MRTTEYLRFELEREVKQWVDREFNNINLENFKIIQEHYGNELFELIEQPELDLEEFLTDYNLWDDFWKFYLDNNEIDKSDHQIEIDHAKENGYEFYKGDINEFIQFEGLNDFESFKDSQLDNNYPIWDTLFEFRSEPPAEMLEKAQAAGFGLIAESDGAYNSTLFVAGAGYSFYGSHWIPLYLSYFDQDGKYKDVDYSSL